MPATPAAAAVSTATSVVVETPAGTILTTTVFTTSTPTGEAAALPSSTTTSADNVPVGAIAGGAVAGVFLAVAAVIAWHLWGRNIRRKEAEKRKQAVRSAVLRHRANHEDPRTDPRGAQFAFFQVRENTRRNASTLSSPYSTYRPPAGTNNSNERKVKFVHLNQRTTSDASTATAMSEKEKTGAFIAGSYNTMKC